MYWPNYPYKNDWRGRPFLPEIVSETYRVGAKSPIFDLFSPVAPQLIGKRVVDFLLIELIWLGVTLSEKKFAMRLSISD